jgi:AraC-like DNA-binding protein
MLYKCHAGLNEFIIPIKISNTIIAFLQCGQIIDHSPLEESWIEIYNRLNDSGLDLNFNTLKKAYFKTPVIKPLKQKMLLELLEIFVNYVADTGNKILLLQRDRKSQIVNLAVLYVRNHFDEKLNLTNIADAAFTSKRNLTRVFFKEMGMTVFDYLQRIRIEFFCDRLLDKHGTIIESAYDCGFASIQQFNRVFKKIKGCTPSEWKAREVESLN